MGTKATPLSGAGGAKERSGELSAKPVGYAPVANGGSQNGSTKNGGKEKKKKSPAPNRLTRSRLLMDERISSRKNGAGEVEYWYVSSLGFEVKLDPVFDEEVN